MSQFSDYLEDQIIESTLRGAAFTVPSGVYVALFTADPTDDPESGSFANEVQTSAWPAYVRQDSRNGGAAGSGWTASANGVSTNAQVVTFPANDGAGSVTVTHIGLVDSGDNATPSGNLLYHAPLVASKTLLVGDVLSFAIGAITVTVA